MVALAPITNETPAWDVLDRFPKLHSRAREVKPPSCTDVPHSKSLGCVEIWLTIYESCDGLESFTRDPIDYEGSEWNLYEFLASSALMNLDPMGLERPIVLPKPPRIPVTPRVIPIAGGARLATVVPCSVRIHRCEARELQLRVELAEVITRTYMVRRESVNLEAYCVVTVARILLRVL